MEKRCIIIPAIKKNAVIPDQLVKKLAGVTLIERAIETARAVAQGMRRTGAARVWKRCRKKRMKNLLLPVQLPRRRVTTSLRTPPAEAPSTSIN